MTAQWPIPLMPCYFMAMPSIFPLANTIDLMFVLGVERLVSVLFPIWYHAKANAMKNVPLVIFVVCFAKNSYLFYFCFQNASMTPDRLVFCLPSDVFLGFVQALSANLGLVANISTMILYAILWITIKTRHNDNTTTSATAAGVNHQINRSLFVLMIIYLSCWFPSILANIIIPNLTLDARTIVLTNRMILQLNRVATALNAPILYFCSSEYRSAFRKELGRFLGRGNRQHQSTLMTNTIAHRIGPRYPAETHHHHQWQGQQRRQLMTMPTIN